MSSEGYRALEMEASRGKGGCLALAWSATPPGFTAQPPTPGAPGSVDLCLYATTSAWISIDLRRQIHQGMFLDTS